jgi:hypothetical protein
VVSESIRIEDVSCDRVWNLIRPAELATHLSEGCVRAYTESGSEGGVGEIQAFIYLRDGVEEATRLEVVAERPPRMARTRSLGTEINWTTQYDLASVDGAVELRMTLSFEIPARQVLANEEIIRRETRKYLGRVREYLESESA